MLAAIFASIVQQSSNFNDCLPRNSLNSPVLHVNDSKYYLYFNSLLWKSNCMSQLKEGKFLGKTLECVFRCLLFRYCSVFPPRHTKKKPSLNLTSRLSVVYNFLMVTAFSSTISYFGQELHVVQIKID